jgi:hypothetical protein
LEAILGYTGRSCPPCSPPKRKGKREKKHYGSRTSLVENPGGLLYWDRVNVLLAFLYCDKYLKQFERRKDLFGLTVSDISVQNQMDSLL